MVAPTTETLKANRLHEVHARRTVAETLRAVALDSVDPFAHERMCAADWECLCELVAEPVDAATAAALEILTAELGRQLAGAPPGLLERLDRLRTSAGLGYD